MTFYARPSGRLVRQVLADAFVAVWVVAWWFVGRAADATLRALADPARLAARTASDLKHQLGDAAARAAEVPFVGDRLRGPFEQMSGTVDGLVSSANGQVTGIENFATLAGWVVFAAPALLLIAFWLPVRMRFATKAASARNLARQPHGDELLALRALANRPLSELTRAASDPVAAWKSGDPAVLARLADVELAASGVRRPRRT